MTQPKLDDEALAGLIERMRARSDEINKASQMRALSGYYVDVSKNRSLQRAARDASHSLAQGVEAIEGMKARTEQAEQALRQIEAICGNIVFNLSQANPAWADASTAHRDEFRRTAQHLGEIAMSALRAQPSPPSPKEMGE